MVHSYSTTTADRGDVSLARSVVDTPQPVSVTINGFEYRGEVLFADLWQPWFGAQLPERVMFRLVLLSESQRVDRTDVTDRFITVAMPREQPYGKGSDEFTQLSREIGRLNEIRERYVTSADSGLQALASSLTGKATDAQNSIATALAERWRNGQIVTSSDNGATIASETIFIGDDPTTWVEATAATMFTHNGDARFEHEFSSPASLFSQIGTSTNLDWREELDSRLQLASGRGLDSLIQMIQSLADHPDGNVPGSALVDLLLRRFGLPPGLASILVAAFIRLRNGEIAFSPTIPTNSTRLNWNSLSTVSYDPELIYAIVWLSERQIGDWDSALPYIRALLPPASAAVEGIPDPLHVQHLAQVIEIMAARNQLTLRTLSSVSGSTVESLPAVLLVSRLAPVLEATDWQSFHSAAVEAFPDVSEFTRAVAESSRIRNLCEDVVDIHSAHEYVAAADYGRLDQQLAADGGALIVALDASAIVESHRPAVSVLQEFQRWKAKYTSVYRIHHAERKSADLELARRVERADLQLVAVRKLTTIPELDDILDLEFISRWDELKEQIRPCANREDELALQERPYCQDCGVRMGSPAHDDEVDSRIAEIEQMLSACSVRLSEIAVSRVLSGQREEELRKLISMNALADLTSMSHVLDRGVMSFLHRFADSTPTDRPQGRAE